MTSAGILHRFGHYLVPNLFDLALDYFDFHEKSFLLKETPGFQVYWLAPFFVSTPSEHFLLMGRASSRLLKST